MPQQSVNITETGDTIEQGFGKVSANADDAEGRLTTLEGIDTTVAWDEVQNKPQTFPTTWDEVSGKPTIYPTNWQSVADKPESYPPSAHEHSHFTRADNPHNTTREQVQAAPVYSQTINMLADSGRFAGKVNPQSLTIPNTFVASSFFGAFNGALVSHAGKFVHNNSTNGGGGAALTEDVQDLLAAMDRTGNNARYGVEFYILQLTAGSGTVFPAPVSLTRYMLTSNNNKALSGFSNYVTFVFWIRLKAGASLVILNRGGILKDGLAVQGDLELTPADGWTHLHCEYNLPTGYNSSLPYLFASSGDVVQIACAAVFSGQAYPGIHTAPLPSFNEQVQV